MVAHIVLITLGYTAGAGRGFVGELWSTWSSTAPGMLLATAGTLLLVHGRGDVVRAARRRLRYESWHLLHLYAYLGVGLALPHQLWTGADFLGSPGRQRLLVGAVRRRRRPRCWSSGSALPVWRTLRHRPAWSATSSRSRRTSTSVYLRGPQPAPAAGRGPASSSRGGSSTAAAGPGPTRTRCPRPPTADTLRITVKDLGDGSARLRRAAARHPGARRGTVRPAARRREGTRRKVMLAGPASASPRCARCSRSCRPALTRPSSSTGSAVPTTPSSPTSWSTWPAPGADASTASSATRPAAAARRGPRDDAPCCSWCQTSPSGTSSSAVLRPGSTRSSRPPSTPASRPPPSHRALSY